MNTDRSATSYARRLASRAISIYHNNARASINAGQKVAQYGTSSDYTASIVTYVDNGNAAIVEAAAAAAAAAAVVPVLASESGSGSGSGSGAGAEPEPEPGPAPEIAFIPTTWVDASGVDFSSSGQAVAYGNGKWIAVGADSTNTIKASTDGVTWTDVDNQMPSSGGGGAGVYGIATDGSGNWVAVGNKNTAAGAITILFSSDNGVTWLSNSAYDSGFNLTNGFTDRGWDVAYANGLWIAVGHYNVGIGYERNVKIATTFDPVNGPNWSNSPAGTGNAAVFGSSNPAMCVAYGNGVWCIGGQDMNATPKGSIFYSTNAGTSWTKATNSFRGQCMGIDTDGAGNWVAVGMRYFTGGSYVDAKPIKYSSDNGLTWTDTTTATGSLFTSGYSVKYMQTSGGGVWVATGSGNSQTILYSTDNGATWSAAGSNRFTSNGYDIYYGGDRWVAVGDGGSGSIKYSIA
jgi:hypothetical protein